MRPARALAVALTLSLLPTGALALEPLRHDLARDVATTAAAAAFWVGTELGKRELAPERCRFCGTNRLDAGVRDLLVVGDVREARRASDVVAFGLLPAGIAAHQLLAARAEGDLEAGAQDVLFVLQAAAVSASVNQIVKLAVGRQRPGARFGLEARPDRPPDPDDNLSFYSGHTAVAFSLASAAGTVSSLRGYPSAPWVWAVGMIAASGAGYLRMAGDQHYLSDVLVGAIAGSGIGVALPLLLHPRSGGAASGARSGPAVVPLPLGILVTF